MLGSEIYVVVTTKYPFVCDNLVTLTPVINGI